MLKLRFKKPSKFAQAKVIEHFTTSECRVRRGETYPEQSIIVDFIRNTCSPQAEILEAGGGSGWLLDLIASNTSIKELYNCELVAEAYRNQANENIALIGGTMQSLPFKDSSFGYTIVVNVLHHMVSGSRRNSQENCRQGIGELGRVAKNGGYIIILEQYNQYRLFNSILFYITSFLSVFGVSFSHFGLKKNSIVSFLTLQEIENMLLNQNKADVEIVLNQINLNTFAKRKRYKYTLLMSNTGRLLLIGKVHKWGEIIEDD